MLVSLFSLLLLPSLALGAGDTIHAVYVGNDTVHRFAEEQPLWGRAKAHATFEDTLNKTGWGVLRITTNPDVSDPGQSYAAGFLEGEVTAKHIYTTYLNLMQVVFPAGSVPTSVTRFLDDQEAWTRSMIHTQAKKDPFWLQMEYLNHQYIGLEKGYQSAAAKGQVPKLDHFAFQLLNGLGDLFDIKPAVEQSMRVDWGALTTLEAEELHQVNGHCSAIIRVTGNYSDLLMGHSSWFHYSNTNRIFKYYTLNHRHESTKAKTVSFSSYPGFLESLDDFYQTSAGLGMVQTTNGVLDHSVYNNTITPKSLLAWQRVRLASSMATSGKEWRDTFSRYGSGTYANQYMVVDFKRFTPGQPLQSGVLWVIEEMPGLIVGKDQTEALKLGYWSSYNIPYYPEILEGSGYNKMFKKTGSVYFTHELAPRAKIFRRDVGKVTGIQGIKNILRYNDYKNDPYSYNPTTKQQDASYAICSRGDLGEGTTKKPDGCYDTKVTSFLFRGGNDQLKAEIINGETVGNGNLPVFDWDKAPNFEQLHPRFGLPTKYDFPFVKVSKRAKQPTPELATIE